MIMFNRTEQNSKIVRHSKALISAFHKLFRCSSSHVCTQRNEILPRWDIFHKNKFLERAVNQVQDDVGVGAISFLPQPAFTLAEILTVLGIIGTVANLTIPTLMNNIQETQYKSAAKTAFSKASQAIQQMKEAEGGSLSSYYFGDNNFQPAFINYFKILKDCGIYYNGHLCVVDSTASDIYTSLSGTKADTNVLDDGQFVTADGMFFGFENCYGPILITVDVNGYIKKPNIYGKDVFMFQIVNDILLPMGAMNTTYSSDVYCNRDNTSSFQGFGCMANVMQGIDY